MQDVNTNLKEGYFIHVLPVKWLEGKKEGESIYLTNEDKSFILQLTLNQTSYRYQRFGKFEETLEKLLTDASR